MESIVTLPMCPHCKKPNMTFYLRGEYEHRNKFYALWKCGYCGKAVCTEGRVRAKDKTTLSFFSLAAIYPELTELDVPDGTPGHIGETYFAASINALGDFSGMWSASAIMSRKCIEQAVTDFGAKGGNLKQKIENLAERGIIAPALRDWANEIREIGNQGAHKEPVTREDAQEAVYFTEMLLTYLYKLPKMIEERKNRKKV